MTVVLSGEPSYCLFRSSDCRYLSLNTKLVSNFKLLKGLSYDLSRNL
jgi:hypothetical protein